MKFIAPIHVYPWNAFLLFSFPTLLMLLSKISKLNVILADMQTVL